MSQTDELLVLQISNLPPNLNDQLIMKEIISLIGSTKGFKRAIFQRKTKQYNHLYIEFRKKTFINTACNNLSGKSIQNMPINMKCVNKSILKSLSPKRKSTKNANALLSTNNVTKTHSSEVNDRDTNNPKNTDKPYKPSNNKANNSHTLSVKNETKTKYMDHKEHKHNQMFTGLRGNKILTVRLLLECGVRIIDGLIGKDKQTIKKIENESNCKIEIIHSTQQQSMFNLCIISGTKNDIISGIYCIINKIYFVKKFSSSNTDCITLLVEHNNIGYLIGYKGTTIKDIERKTGSDISASNYFLRNSSEKAVNISGNKNSLFEGIKSVLQTLIQHPNYVNRAAKPFNILRCADCVTYDSLFERDTVNNNNNNSRCTQLTQMCYSFRLLLEGDRLAIGNLIGICGMSIKHIQRRSGCKIEVINPNNSIFHICVIDGSSTEIITGINLIIDKMSETAHAYGHMHGSNPYSVTLLVEYKNVGHLIGNNGCDVKQIENQTKTDISASKSFLNESSEKAIEISGCKDDVHHAVELVVKQLISNPQYISYPIKPFDVESAKYYTSYCALFDRSRDRNDRNINDYRYGSRSRSRSNYRYMSRSRSRSRSRY